MGLLSSTQVEECDAFILRCQNEKKVRNILLKLPQMPAKPPTPVTNLALQEAILKGMAKAEQSVKVSTF